jgi:hypothetical protein
MRKKENEKERERKRKERERKRKQRCSKIEAKFKMKYSALNCISRRVLSDFNDPFLPRFVESN